VAITPRKRGNFVVKSFFDHSRLDLLDYVERPARAGRVFRSIYRSGAQRFDDVVDIPGSSRENLAKSVTLDLPFVTQRFDSADGTRRYLMRLSDGETVESVMIPSDDRVTFCISSQIGCALGCTFCLTGQLGLIRDLSAGEIVSQVVMLHAETPQPRFSIVLMGMGEPLQNYDNVMKAIDILHDDHGLAVPISRITLSTAGLVPGIERLSQERLFPNLSVSLTGVTNATRDTLMPINRKYPTEQLFECIRRMPLKRQRRVMFECVMIKDVTDSLDDAYRLSEILEGMPVKVNLIPLNPSSEIPFQRSDNDAILRFQETLVRNGTAAFIRRNRGNDISGACGQLKKNVLV
jgi:23S rRNA (adenine2503-C2)-methyltransferase